MLKTLKRYLPRPIKVLLRSTYDRTIGDWKAKRALSNIDSIVAKRPIKLALETYSACNAKCIFCARPRIKPSRDLMSLDLFRKICTEYSEMGGGFMGYSPLIADPLLDPHILDRIRLQNDEFPLITPHMFTNLISLPQFSDDDVILMLKSLDHIDVSIGGITEDDYYEMFRVRQFENVAKSMKRLGDLNASLGSPCTLQLHIRTNKMDKVKQSAELQELLSYGFTCNDIRDEFADWGGMLTTSDLPEGASVTKIDVKERTTPCFMPKAYMTIMPDGRVLGCGCMDGKEETLCGNLNEASMNEIWHGKEFNELRNSFQAGQLHNLCKTCSFYHDYEHLCSSPGLANFTPQKNFWKHI